MSQPAERRRHAGRSINRDQLYAILQHSLAGIAVVVDGRTIYANPAFTRIFGFRPADAPALRIEEIHPDDRDSVAEFIAGWSDPIEERLDLSFRLLHGGPGAEARVGGRRLLCRARPIDLEGRDGMLVNVQDMSDAWELQQLLATSDRMRSLGRVATGITHEIRNALSSVNLYLAALRRAVADDAGAERAERIIDELEAGSRRIEVLMDRVRDFSRPSEPDTRPENLNGLVDEAVVLCDHTIRKSEVELTCALAADLPSCDVDRHLLLRVILNLLHNAVDATVAAGDGVRAIRISTFGGNNRLVLEVADSGGGVPEHLRPKVFEPFYTTKGDGTGIGLSICYRIVADHGGRLLIGDSALGGAAFIVELPLSGQGLSP